MPHDVHYKNKIPHHPVPHAAGYHTSASLWMIVPLVKRIDSLCRLFYTFCEVGSLPPSPKGELFEGFNLFRGFNFFWICLLFSKKIKEVRNTKYTNHGDHGDYEV